MTALAIPLIILFTVLTVLLFAFGVRRLLGLQFSALRTLAAGVLAFVLASPIITALSGHAVLRQGRLLPGLWFVILGVVVALLVGMVFLVVAEALVPSGSLPGPLYVVRGLRGWLQRTRRYAQISRILLRHGLTPYLRGRRRAELATSQGRAQLARALRLALDDGGVTFVKLGQVISTRRDIVPPEFVAELGQLQDHAARVGWPEIEAVLRDELGADPGEVFASLDQVPLAAASVAQVHAATLKSGQAVVVKVRRPGVRGAVDSDLDILDRLARRLEQGTRWGRSIGAVTLARGFAAALREELDLRIEVSNLTAVGVAAGRDGTGADGVRVPAPVTALCTGQVLVMERLDGVSLTAAGPLLDRLGTDRTELAGRLLDSLLRQIMLDGVFHADPHPGNILLLRDGGLGLLDFGSVGRIDAALRGALQRLLLALDQGDPVRLTDALLEVVERPEDLDELALERNLGRFMTRYLAPGLAPDVRMFADLFRIVAEHGLAVPPEIAAVFRSLGTLEGTLTSLAPDFDVIAAARAFATGAFASQFRPEALQQRAAQELTALLPMLRRLPRRLDGITTAIETGQVSVNVRLLAHEADRRVVTGLLHLVLITFLAAAAGIMAVLLLGLHGGPALTPRVSLYQFLGYCLLAVAAILALRVLVQVFRPARS
ncbi:MAG TPA: AarF/UbiB family protein [Streptosporangiaceae bacterium]|nr:AarF/UbiB family protein [Streptosporangiaceae bacterium]